MRIAVEEIKPRDILRLEPNLNPKLLQAFIIPDGTFDPLRLALAFAASAKKYGAKFYTFTEVEKMIVDGKGNVIGVQVLDRASQKRRQISSDVVVNATGAWAGEIAEMAGAHVPVKPAPGVMVAFENRFVQRAVNRLNRPGDGDIVLPQRRMVVVGTTSFQVEDLDYVPVYKDHVQKMIDRGSMLIPKIKDSKMRGRLYGFTPSGRGGSGPQRSSYL